MLTKNEFFTFPTRLTPTGSRSITPHSRVAHRYLGTASLPNEHLKLLKTVLKSTVGSERVKLT